MRVIVGLGNPGPQYTGTRHNAGFDTLDRMSRALGLAGWRKAYDGLLTEWRTQGGERVVLLKPQTYMNRSGGSVQPLLAYHKVELSACLVIADDLNLPEGEIRLREKGSHGGHNGLRDIAGRLGTSDFPRLKVGIGRPVDGMDPADYVLASMPAEARERLAATVAQAADVAMRFGLEGFEAAARWWSQECQRRGE